MARISEVSIKIRKISRFYDLDHITTTRTTTTESVTFKNFRMPLANPGGKRLKPIKEISQEELNACLYVSTHYEDSSYKSSSMKSVRAAAIMFVSVARYHSARHLHKREQLLRFSISLKFKTGTECLSQ